MAASHQLCDICDHRHITKPSTVWCPECEQAFCDDCTDYHGFSRSSKHHVTVSIQDYSAMSSISQTSNMCNEHNEQYQMICKAHDELLCLKCIENHDECKGIVPLSKVLENVKKSSLFQETKQSLKDIDQNIKTLQSELKKQQESLERQEENILARIIETKKKINDQFDKLEKKIRNEIIEITSESNHSIKQTLQMLESSNTNTHHAEKQLHDIDRYGTDLQTYLGLRKISSEAATTESYLQSIIEDHSVDETTLLLNIDDKIDTICDDITTFGSVELQKTPYKLSLIRHKNKEAQIVETRIKSIGDIKLRLVKTIKHEFSDIKGIVALPSGNIAISGQSTGNVAIFSTNRKIPSKVSVKPANAFDVTYIDDITVATTSDIGSRIGVNIVDISLEKVTKYIPTKYKCYGITHHNGSLFVCAFTEGIFKLNLLDGSSTLIIRSDLPSWSYIEIFDNIIYYTNDGTRTVTSCDMNGKEIWTFKNERILKYPHGIAVDNSGNVDVACSKSHHVVVISPDGQHCRILLSQDDALRNPCAIHFDRKGKHLLVINNYGDYFIYDGID
ncbi:uncharacterized protein [Mytilus edulis]|uniref:uncharacterized protein n=1 Tax=Mytilus edulis TaxID=6550 RepID=UPI0039EF77A2